ncbi:MAG: hypothetical protein HQ402_02720 [Parcubacteria group bacterium]|nr:hypothetical protein [Parcubacteria group bacterium]
MNENKDIPNQGDQNSLSKDLKNIDPITFFEQNKDFIFVYKKLEKLISAVYMITNFFSENEPLKWSIRDLSGQLISQIIDIKDRVSADRNVVLDEIKNLILDLVSRLEVAHFAGLISEMNFSILKKEFSILLGALVEKNSSEQKFLFPGSFFEIPDNRDAMPSIGQVPKSRSDFSRTKNITQEPSALSYRDNNVRLPKEDFSKGHISQPSKTHSAEGPVKNKKNNRQNIIVGFLAKNKVGTIKDISLMIKGCSEKTVQRELLFMVKNGVLKKEGERRWSRYSLT